MSKKSDETSCFMVANEKHDHTKRPCANLFDKDANAIIDSLRNTAVCQTKADYLLTFSDMHISIGIPKNLCPLKYFHQCIFPQTTITQNWENDPHFLIIQSNDTSTTINYFKIKFIDQQNTIFKSINSINYTNASNSSNPISILECNIPINLPAELDTKSTSNVNKAYSEAIQNDFKNVTWETVIKSISNQIGISPTRLVLRHIFKGSDEILFPFDPVAPLFLEMFRAESYQFGHSFTFSVISERIRFTDQVSVPFAETEISRVLASLSSKSIKENSIIRLSALQDDIFNLLSKKDFIGFLPTLLTRITQELSTGEFDQYFIPAVKNILSVSLVSIFSPFVSTILKKNVTKGAFSFTTWEVFVNWVTSLKNPSIYDFNIDIDNYARETISILLGLAIVTHADFADQCVDICNSFISFFSENRLFPQTNSLMGPVVVATTVIIEKEELQLILTRGFVYLLSLPNTKREKDQDFVALPNMFKISNKSSVVCALPITQWEFLPIVSSTIGCFSGPKMIKVNFTSKNAVNDILSFWLYFTLAKNEINKQIVDLPVLQHAKIRLSYPYEMKDFLVSSTVTVLNHTWSSTFSMDQVMTCIAENGRLATIFPSVRKLEVPNLFSGETQIQACSQSFESLTLSNAIQFLRTDTFLKEDENKIAELIKARHMVHCALHDVFFGYNSQILFSILLLFRLSDPTYSIMIRSIDLLNLQLDTFHLPLSMFNINNTPLLHFASLTCNDPSFVQCIAKKLNLSNQDSEGMTALFYALKNPNISILQTLIEEKKIDIDKPNNKGISPLIYFIENNDYKRAKYLLQNGASINKFNQSALFYAINKKKEKAAKLLISHCGEEINTPFVQGCFITHQCIKKNFTTILNKANLSSSHFDPNLYSDAYPHPLHYLIAIATSKDSSEFDSNNLESTLNDLLSIPNMDLNALDEEGNTPLINAIKKDADFISHALIADDRCDVDLLGGSGETPLCLAISKKKISTINNLLAAGALVNLPNAAGKSPLCLATEMNEAQIVSILLNGKALPNQWYFDGCLPVNRSANNVKELLVKNGAKENFPIFRSGHEKDGKEAS